MSDSDNNPIPTATTLQGQGSATATPLTKGPDQIYRTEERAAAVAAAQPSAVAPVQTIKAAVATQVGEPLVQRDDKFLIVDPTRDAMTSGFKNTASTVNADMFLEEGISLSGTHYGLNLISTSGVVLITKDAQILPSKQRPSRIAGQKVVIAGEAVCDKVQGDKLLALSDTARVVIGEALRGEASLITDKADWIFTRGARKLSPREPRVSDLYAAAMHASTIEDGGFEAVRRALEESVDAGLPQA